MELGLGGGVTNHESIREMPRLSGGKSKGARASLICVQGGMGRFDSLKIREE